MIALQNQDKTHSATHNFPVALNPHYDFDHAGNQAEIEKIEAFTRAYAQGDVPAMEAQEKLSLGGHARYQTGDIITSPWGSNKVIEANIQKDFGTITKEMVIKSGNMLSLQKHRGRREHWSIKTGTLTAIIDGKIIEKTTGQTLQLEQGTIHSINNLADEDLTIIEIQEGQNYEADIIRLLDFHNRPVYPLTTETELDSAKLYAKLHNKIHQTFGCDCPPNSILLNL